MNRQIKRESKRKALEREELTKEQAKLPTVQCNVVRIDQTRAVQNCSFGFDFNITAGQSFISKPILGMADFKTNTDINIEEKPISKSISISIFS